MRGFEWRTILAAAVAGTGLFLSAGAQADDDRWHDDRWRWEHSHHGYWHHEPERRVIVEREPVVVERPRPVYVAPAPVMMAPVYSQPAYSQPADPSLNFNFNIPLR